MVERKKQIKPELADPLEGIDARHVLLNQFGHDILGMDLNDDEGREHSSLHPAQLASHQLHQVTKLWEQTAELSGCWCMKKFHTVTVV